MLSIKSSGINNYDTSSMSRVANEVKQQIK